MNTKMVEEQSVVVDERPVCCRVLAPTRVSEGGLPILLLHGLGCSGNAWGPTMEEFAKRGTGQPVYAPDLPGYGGSPGPRAALGMAALADWVVRLMDRMGVARAHLAGHSMGCQVVLELARRHPERVGGLVLIGPTTGEQRVPYWRYLIGLFRDGFREPLRYNLVLLKMYAQMGIVRYLATVRKMMEDEPLGYASEIAVPCLVLRGDHDRIVPLEVAQELAATLPRGRFVLVNEAAHALQFSKAWDLVDLVVPFWQESETPLSAFGTFPP